MAWTLSEHDASDARDEGKNADERWRRPSQRPRAIRSLRSVVAVHPVVGRLDRPSGGLRTLRHRWWGEALRERAAALAEVFAIDLQALAVSDHAIVLALRRRPDLARQWDPEELGRRRGRGLARANLFAHAGTPAGTPTEVDAGSLPRLRAALADDRCYRRALLGWVQRRDQLAVGGGWPFGAALVGRVAEDGDPAPIAAALLTFLEWSEFRDAAERHSSEDAPRLTLGDLTDRHRFAALVTELRRAPRTPTSVRPQSAALRASFGDERFDAMQRIAVEAIETPFRSCTVPDAIARSPWTR